MSSPAYIPPGWRQAYDATRARPFYINGVSGHAQWETPLYPASELPSDAAPMSGGTGELFGFLGATKPDEASAGSSPPVVGKPLTTGSVSSVTEPAPVAGTSADGAGGGRSVVATHIAPSQERKAGTLCVMLGGPQVVAPAARAKAAGDRWCVVEAGEFFVLPAASSSASEVQLKLGLVGVRGVSCPSELQAGAPYALSLELSPAPRSREGWLGMGSCEQLVLVAASAEEQAEWQMTLQRVATAYRNWRRVSEAPGAVLGGLKSVGVSRPGGSN
eukprot:Transcript_26205.p2 GENE.Transcript_26205~~Transcript_26205.p2  ORF type:complete len:274 (-),score=66.85 Transcript_26205:1620-2441(-)